MIAHLPIFGTLLAIAAAADVAQRRVPNAIVAPLAVAGVAVQWGAGGAAAAAKGVLAGAIVVLGFAYPWARGKIGGGDVKLGAAAAVWLGLDALVPFLLCAGAAGVPVALAARLAHRVELRRLARATVADGIAVERCDVPRETVPLAVAVAVGALAVVHWGAP